MGEGRLEDEGMRKRVRNFPLRKGTLIAKQATNNRIQRPAVIPSKNNASDIIDALLAYFIF